MAHWENDWGEEFETEEEARENVLENIEWADYEEQFFDIVPFHNLFEWARKQDGFFEDFEMELCEAENRFFNDNYHEIKE